MTKQPCEAADTIRRFAKNYRKADIDFDRSGVQWLDGFIEWSREKGVDSHGDARIFALGSFFGACIIGTFGGRWAFVENCWQLKLDSLHDIDPYLCIRSHLEHGRRSSVLAAFDSIRVPLRPNDEPLDQDRCTD